MQSHLRLATLVFVFASLLCCQAIAQRPGKPNVIVILVDDLGWQDVGCYDIDEPCPYETPNLDKMASRGIKFWQAYSPAPTCAPSRAAILSGKHPARAQKTHVVGGAPPTPYQHNAPLIDPWYSGRMKLSEVTIAEALKTNGYATGHAGKWHVAINHHAFPTPLDQGFDFTRMNRGAHSRMPNRLENFATTAKDDPYQLDAEGFPRHENVEDALEFMNENRTKPFFLYFCTFLVHTPIHSRSEALVKKYCKKMNVEFPNDPKQWKVEGQRNPFYGAMVESLDHYVGKVMDYVSETEDPRWPGHKLSENTWVIFTSDNGGMEKHPGEIITDNYPLDKGKINAKEGGVRVPMLIMGPDLKTGGVESNAMVNGLDFYPTILGLTGTQKPESQQLDGCDLGPYLNSDLSNPELIVDSKGQPRDMMAWHFPHSSFQSTIRKGNFKLIRNWAGRLMGKGVETELYQLYDDAGKRVDIEEANNLAAKIPEKAGELGTLLDEFLADTDASPPLLNPNCKQKVPGSDNACKPLKNGRNGNKVWATFEENGSRVVKANLIWTDNGGHKYEEWYRQKATINGDKIEATLPKKATHYVFNLIDEKQFLVSVPEMKFANDKSEKYSAKAISTGLATKPGNKSTKKAKKPAAFDPVMFARMDTNEDGQVSREEFIGLRKSEFARKDKNGDGNLDRSEHKHASFERADANKDDKLTEDEYLSIFDRHFNAHDRNKDGVLTNADSK